MRVALIIALCALGTAARAQEQERKLVARLLEPNMKLGNSAQNKRFTGAAEITAKSASARSFYISDRRLTKSFAGSREFATTSYSSRSFASKDANLPPPHRTRTFDTSPARRVSSAREASTAYKTRQYASTRPFVEEGKSQKALHQQDRPLSIDDVRELLNKNK